ncbi:MULTISPECIES: hypothetical protein [Amycolatopsis]|uniref:Uncharacterized protein n=2 Tax=Amycolatopsis TaxID=1813 RepID=A0ABV5U5L5_9PSEU|nr:hypothetical protein [Amycolatopsis bullii]GHF99120.1 hypothetical protein GCM10017567_12480 [Amycolatopsis bullii]
MSADSIRDLFSAQVERTFAGSDERMYRTGDLARVGRDGGESLHAARLSTVAGPAALVDATQSTAA